MLVSLEFSLPENSTLLEKPDENAHYYLHAWLLFQKRFVELYKVPRDLLEGIDVLVLVRICVRVAQRGVIRIIHDLVRVLVTLSDHQNKQSR